MSGAASLRKICEIPPGGTIMSPQARAIPLLAPSENVIAFAPRFLMRMHCTRKPVPLIVAPPAPVSDARLIVAAPELSVRRNAEYCVAGGVLVDLSTNDSLYDVCRMTGLGTSTVPLSSVSVQVILKS